MWILLSPALAAAARRTELISSSLEDKSEPCGNGTLFSRVHGGRVRPEETGSEKLTEKKSTHSTFE